MDPLLDDRPVSTRSPATRRPRRPARMVVPVALTAALALVGVGVLVGTGTVKTPLSASDVATPVSSATAVPSGGSSALAASAAPVSQPSAVSTFSYALASVPAAPKPSPKASPKASKSPKASPSVSPSASPSASTASASATAPASAPASTPVAGVVTPPNLPENVTPKGATQLAWSEALLTALGAPVTSANVISMGYWMQNEAGAPPYGLRGENNPINVSQSCCGGVPIQSDGDGVTFLQSYPTAADGVEATKEYLERPNYPQIVADLRAGVGLGGSDVSSEISLFAGGHYSTIPDSYGQGQGQPETP